MANSKGFNDAVNHPDFWGEGVTNEDRAWVLSKADKEFGRMPPQEQARFLQNMEKSRAKNTQAEQKDMQTRAQVAQELTQGHQTWFQSAMEPLTNAVGMGMEAATTMGVPLARMAQGEGVKAAFGPESFTQIGAGGKAKETRMQAGAGVVPQSPWQAGAIGAQFIPGMAAAGPMARIGGAMAGAGGLQALLGERGLLEGGKAREAAVEGATGALKGGATQAVGEGLGKLVGMARRLPLTNAAGRAAQVDTRHVMEAVKEISPELQPGKGMQAAGEYFTGSKRAAGAAGQAFQTKLRDMEAELIKATGSPYLQSPELTQAWRQLLKAYGKDPVLGKQLAEIAPYQGGFLPEQAAKVVSLTGQRLGSSQTAAGHLKDQAMDDLVNAIESSLPANAKGILPAARGGYARAMGLQELLAPAFKPGKRGYQFDIRQAQEALSKDPDFLNRLGPDQLKRLFESVTRGATKGPGFADVPVGNLSVPYPSTQGAAVATIRNLLTRGSRVGKHPLSLPQGAQAGLGVTTTAISSMFSRPGKKSTEE